MATTKSASPVTRLPGLSSMPVETLLRSVLKIDAVVSGANGLVYLSAAGLLDAPLGLSSALLRPLGAFLLAFAGGVYYVATRRPIRRKQVGLVIALNALWVLDSVVAVAGGWLTPTVAGSIWVAGQTVVVAGFAALQRRALASSTSR